MYTIFYIKLFFQYSCKKLISFNHCFICNSDIDIIIVNHIWGNDFC